MVKARLEGRLFVDLNSSQPATEKKTFDRLHALARLENKVAPQVQLNKVSQGPEAPSPHPAWLGEPARDQPAWLTDSTGPAVRGKQTASGAAQPHSSVFLPPPRKDSLAHGRHTQGGSRAAGTRRKAQDAENIAPDAGEQGGNQPQGRRR